MQIPGTKVTCIVLRRVTPCAWSFLIASMYLCKKICNKLLYLLNLTSTIKLKNSTPTKHKIWLWRQPFWNCTWQPGCVSMHMIWFRPTQNWRKAEKAETDLRNVFFPSNHPLHCFHCYLFWGLGHVWLNLECKLRGLLEATCIDNALRWNNVTKTLPAEYCSK